MPGKPTAVIKGVSPRKMVTVWDDPAWDDWPLFALQSIGGGSFYVYDDELRHRIETHDGRLVYAGYDVHNVGHTPAVRYTNMLDLDGRTVGEVEPLIGTAARVNKTVFDRLLIQHFNSWKVRTVSGMAQPEDESEQRAVELLLRQGELLVASDPDTKFGTLDETPLEGIIAAEKTDIESLAAVSQTPTNALTGQLANLNAEGIAAARAGLAQKVYERQKSFGKSHNQMLKLAASLEGDELAASDADASVGWQDTEVRSLSQAVDALGKAAQMLQVPVQSLWGKIPGIDQADVEEWREQFRQNRDSDPMAQLLRDEARQSRPSLDA